MYFFNSVDGNTPLHTNSIHDSINKFYNWMKFPGNEPTFLYGLPEFSVLIRRKKVCRWFKNSAKTGRRGQQEKQPAWKKGVHAPWRLSVELATCVGSVPGMCSASILSALWRTITHRAELQWYWQSLPICPQELLGWRNFRVGAESTKRRWRHR